MSDVIVTAAHIRNAAYGLTIPIGTAVDTAIERLATKALLRVYRAVPSLDQRIDSGELDTDVVVGVVEDMVLRVLRNPEGVRQESIDDYTIMIDTALSSGRLYLSDEERALLTPSPSRGSVRNVRLSIPAWMVPGG